MKKPLITLPVGVTAFLLIVIPVYTWTKVENLTLKVDYPKTYTTGELVVFDASDSILTDLQWAIFPKTANFKIDERKAYFSSPNKETYTIILAGTNGKIVRMLLFTLKHYEGINPVKPINDPFALKLKAWLPKEYNQATAYKLAQSFRSIAVISKNNFNDLEAMILATTYSNKVALDDDFSQWKSFLDKLSLDLEANPPVSIIDCAKRWNLIADTLEKLIK